MDFEDFAIANTSIKDINRLWVEIKAREPAVKFVRMSNGDCPT